MTSPRRKRIKLAKWKLRHPDKYLRQQVEGIKLVCSLSLEEIEESLVLLTEAVKDGGMLVRQPPRLFDGSDVIEYEWKV